VRRIAKRDRYHHGDLREALIDTAVQLIAENGAQAFSLAEASRRLGVAASAPYRHFADRDELLVAAGVRAVQVLVATVAAESTTAATATEQLAGVARGYLRFAAEHRAAFETIFNTHLDRLSHPELERALLPVKEAFESASLALSDGDPIDAKSLALAVVTSAHGHAAMLHLGAFGPADGAVEIALVYTERATLALIAGRAALNG
jgi:AcrR family transcriptional regulator